ncbi:hypothetical protein D9Q98_010627 [Chlorella vulgaris]|uniref:Uncharacterized protein n=1 Tax=Chlorella vulgaris TaxID=3077 RepID=A0A9D4YS19_CHLVU|nr:hypothetical protein D9Q98_010627 [Chlorella vulgaris]
MFVAFSCAWQATSRWDGPFRGDRASAGGHRELQVSTAGHGRFRKNKRSWPARQSEQQRLVVIGESATSSDDSGSAAHRLLQLSQQHDTQAAGDRRQLTADERLARIEMLLQRGVTEETVQRVIERSKGGPYMQSASEGAASLAVLRERGCSDAEMNLLLRQPNIIARPASNVSDVFAALDDMLQLSRADPEQLIRPRWDLYQSLLGMFDPDDKRRFIISPNSLRLPEPTIRNVFSRAEQLMGSTAAAQDMLRLSPKSFACGIKRLATNLGALQELYGCSLQQAQQVLMRSPQLAYRKLEVPKFQSRVAALTEWYGHVSPAAMLLAHGCGTQLKSSLWLLGARMAFIRRLRLERAEPELNTSNLAATTERFCQAVRVSEEEYAAFQQRWLASSEAAELCRHEGRPPHVKVIGAAGAEP